MLEKEREAEHLRVINRRLNFMRLTTTDDERAALYSECRQKLIPIMKEIEKESE